MKILVASIADVLEVLKNRGFSFVGRSDDGWFKAHGKLYVSSEVEGYQCEMHLHPQLSELPRIWLLERPAQLPPIVPHLGSGGYLCYLAENGVVLDIYDPIGQTLACLDRASHVLGKVLNGEMVEDLEEEFFVHWRGNFCLLDLQGKKLGEQQCIVAEKGGLSVWVVTDDEERTSKKLEALGWEVTDFTVLTYRVKTIAKPRPFIESWPPHNVKDILSWQGALDANCRKKIEQRIQQGRIKKANGVLILVESPLMTYGFGVLYKRNSTQKSNKKTSRKNLNYELEVLPMSVVRIDDRYLAERNIPGRVTLAGKKIAIIGCGTIGGYLSEMLVKAGAGTSDGALTLVDSDFLYPQNIGRHRLGFPSLFSNKATAMADELRRLAPGIDIRALPVDVKKASLGKLDLLIDATGEESLGHWLCEKYLEETHMLSVWIDGPGVAVRGLLRSNDSDACYRCLWHKNKSGELNSIHGPLPELLAGHGCEGLYVPFSAAVSVQAASLGLEMALDWVNGTESPKLRTKIIDNNYRLATPDCNPDRSDSCPVCSIFGE